MVLHHDPRRGSRSLGDVTCHLLVKGLEGSVEGLALLIPTATDKAALRGREQ